MADVPLPEPDGVIAAMWNVVRHGPNYDGRQNDVIAAAKAYAERHAAAVSTAKDAEIAQLRAELIKSLADNAALRADAIDRQNNVVAPLRERVRVLEDALTLLRQWGDMGAGYSAIVLIDIRDWIDAGMTGDLPTMPEWAVDREVADAARKGEA